VSWEGAKVLHKAPYRNPSLYSGSQLLAFAIFAKEEFSIDKLQLLIEGKAEGKPLKIMIENKQTTTDNLIHTLTASKVIRDLEEGKEKKRFLFILKGASEYHTDAGQLKQGIQSQTVEKVIEQLGLAYNLASSQTSFVAVDKRGGKAVERSMTIVR
jgi:hypothetical protein